MRQFISDKDVDESGILILKEKDYHYFKDVLRIQIGDMISVRLPDGSLNEMTASKIDEGKKELTLQYCTDIDDFDYEECDITRGVKAKELGSVLKTDIWLFQFLPKMPKFEQIVRQATECGVSVIVPVIGEYTEKSSVASLNGEKKIERILKIVKEARQQSGSPVDTKVLLPVALPEAINQWREHVVDDDSVAFVLCERTDVGKSIPKDLSEEKINVAALVCGSEGGISPSEVELLIKDGRFVPVHFDTNILRCETAAVYGIAALQTWLARKYED